MITLNTRGNQLTIFLKHRRFLWLISLQSIVNEAPIVIYIMIYIVDSRLLFSAVFVIAFPAHTLPTFPTLLIGESE